MSSKSTVTASGDSSSTYLIKDGIVEGWKQQWWLGADSMAAGFWVVAGGKRHLAAVKQRRLVYKRCRFHMYWRFCRRFKPPLFAFKTLVLISIRLSSTSTSALVPLVAVIALSPGEMLSATLNIVGFSWITSPDATEFESIVLDWHTKALLLPQYFLSNGKVLDDYFSEFYEVLP
ncbi:L-tyrosine decarboxylase [Trifolium repens]|nr:L-tyrosine decarboxylase [Trifolium repens]